MSNRVKKSSRLQTIDSNELVIASKRFCSELHLTARLSSASGSLRNFQELSSYKRATNSKNTRSVLDEKLLDCFDRGSALTRCCRADRGRSGRVRFRQYLGISGTIGSQR